MTLTIVLTPQEASRLRSAAKREGILPDALASRIIRRHLHEETASQPDSSGEDPTIALFRRWLDEDATDDPVEIAAAERELEEFKAAMNAERARAGARLLYP